MKKYTLLLSTLLIVSLALAAVIALYIIRRGNCESAGTLQVKEGKYMKLAPAIAKASLDNDSSIILLDVRTEEEYNELHIPGSILIPVTELEERAPDELPDKEAVIFIYCRSGNRSRTAAYQLIEMGYTQVYDIGGIIDWPFEVSSNKEN
jgi:phage shock protein E